MKLKEWKAFLDTIPDNDYTRGLDYTQFTDSSSVDGTDSDAAACFVTLDGKQIYALHADAEKRIVDILYMDSSGNPILDERGELQKEQIDGDVKIVKYKSKP